MAGDGMVIDSSSNRVLWQFISGTGVLRPQELIEHEVKRNHARLHQGLLYYKPFSGTTGDGLKKERKVMGKQLDFVLRLSKFLDLSEVLCHDLFCAYLFNDYRGSKKTLKQVLSHERHSQALMLKIRDFYFTERLYLLRCLHHLLVHPLDHPYQEVYGKFCKELQENGGSLQDKILKQLTSICETPAPSQDRQGPLMSNVQVQAWVIQNLKEQCELLEMVLMVQKVAPMTANTFLAFTRTFKAQGFGLYQTYKRLLDETTEKYIYRVRHLEMLILIQGLDVSREMRCAVDNDFSGSIVVKKEHFEAVQSEMSSLGSDGVHGPLLLAWAMVRHFHHLPSGSSLLPSPSTKEAAETRRLGRLALQLGAFPLLLDLLRSEPFAASSALGAVWHYVVYQLLHAVLSVFQEHTLGSPSVLHELCRLLLCQEAVAEEVWEKDDGLWLLYESAMGCFPLDFSRFVGMTEALASASTHSAIRVKNTLRELSVYTEYLDNNSAHHLQPSPSQPHCFTLAHSRHPYSSGDFVLPKGCTGQVLELSALPQSVAEELCGPLMRWEVNYNGWSLLLDEVGELLRQITHGAGMVQTDQVQRVTMVMQLVHHVLKAETATAVLEFTPFLTLCYDIIHRFSVLRPAPLDLLSAALNCVACAATVCPKEVWHKVTQTGLLPYLTENVDDLGEVLSGRGLNSGALGVIQAGTECTQARYPLTLAVLDMLTTLVQSFSEEGIEEELLACLLHILKEVFPLFRKWRYAHLAHRKLIGQQCLKLFHKVLNLTRLPQSPTDQPPKTMSRPSVHQVCVYSLLFTEAGRALMEIVATGVDNVETALLQQGSLTEGGGVDLIELIQLSLSVLNRLLLLRPPHLPPSPVEQALSWQPSGRQSQHVVATMAQYIYHRHNPKLPTLATLLLKRLAMMSPMSILACLGNDSEPIRDIYLTRLQALSEDLRLKVAILELLSVCVETQPGLIEIFFDVQVGPSDSADGKKGLELGRSSCLQTLLTLLDVSKQTTYHCPPHLLRAGLDLVHSLWRGRTDTAMEALRSKQSFWASVTAPLKRDLLSSGGSETEMEVDPTDVKIVAFSFRILAQELYTVEGSRVDPQLKTCLQELGKADRLVYWSECLRNSLHVEGECGGSGGDEEDGGGGSDDGMSDNPTVLLLKAWRSFLLVISRSRMVDDLQLTNRRKEHIMTHLLEGLQAQFRGQLTSLNIKVASISTALYFTLLKAWGSGVGKPAAILVGVRHTVEEACVSSEHLMPSVHIGLLAALTLLLQRARTDSSAGLTGAAISTLVPMTTAMLLQSTRQLPSPAELARATKMDTGLTTETQAWQMDEACNAKLTLQVALCSLQMEVVLATDVSSWLPHLQEHGVLTALLVSLEAYLKAKQGLSYVHSGLLLLSAVAGSQKGATVLCGSDFTAHTCLPVAHLYLQDDLIPSTTFTAKGGVGITSSWHKVYCLSLELYTLMLRQLGFSFLDDALNFLGAHQERLQQSLELARATLLEAAMTEAENTCNFLHQLAPYRRQWRLHLPHTMMALLNSMLGMVQTFVSLLIRPRYLQHVLERGGESRDKGKRSLQSSPLLQHQTSTDDVDQPTSQLIATENSMLRIIGKCMAILRNFSPDLCQALLDQSMDMCEFEPLVALGFSTPAVDQETPLTFGSLISCVTACLRRLHKLEHKSPSPHRMPSPHRKSPRPSSTSAEPQVPKAMLHYVMENCLTLAMSQACRYLREPSLPPRDKHFLKRELGTELNSFLSSMLRHFRRGATPGSPGDKSALLSSPQTGGATTTSTSTTSSTSTPANTTTTSVSSGGGGTGLTRSMSQTAFSSTSQEQQFFRLLQEFVKKVLR